MAVQTESSPDSATARGRILIVEDDFLIASFLEEQLQDAGFIVVGIAATAERAVALATAERPDLAIVDIRLANGSDGVTAALEMHRTLGTRVIFATAHSDRATTERAAPAEPVGWLQKPYASEAVLSLLERVIKISS